MTMNPFGQSKVGFGSTRTFVKLKDGLNVYRILPAMGDLAAEGRWSFYHAIHYGYKNSAGKLRPFNTCQEIDYKSKVVLVRDAALDRMHQLEAMLEQAKAANDKATIDRLIPLVGRGPNNKAQYNLDKKHYINAVDSEGKVVILMLSHKAKQNLDTEIKKMRATGVDPLSADQGRYFAFFRSGTGRDTDVQVTPFQEEVDVPGFGKVKRDRAHVIDEALIKRLLTEKNGKWVYNEAANLATLYPFPTAAEITRIVNEGATAVDEILDKGKSAAEKSAESAVPAGEDLPAFPSAHAAPAPAVAPQAPIPPMQTTGVNVGPQVTSAPAAPVAPPVTTTAPFAPAAATVNTAIGGMSPEDFLKSIGA